MSTHRIEQLEVCHREMFGDLVLTCATSTGSPPTRMIETSVTYPVEYRRTVSMDSVLRKTSIVENERRRASALVDELLVDIYYNIHSGTTDYNSATSGKSHKNSWVEVVNLQEKDTAELKSILSCLNTYVERMGSVLVRRLKRRDALRRQQEAYCDIITRQLAKREGPGTADMRFTIQPAPGESGFSQWAAAMKMVAQLPGGIPPEFRRRLWLTLADRHLASRGVDWPKVERSCFSEWSHPDDAELGVQIVKDLHRTGCSLFCGEDGQENQALLKRVLLAYARWNKAVGYCQGFNMLAALILQVTDKCESDALKLMIYLIEGVLPDSYFADSLRGLSVDMAVFRELLRSKLPRLSRHLDTLQNAAKDGTRSYEPPLTNVFTMQWFLTLFCNCLPQPTVLRVWDLILLEGNEILLRTALAIWQVLGERILTARSADEFYCIMGVLTRELLEFGLVDGNSLIKAVIAIGPLTELKNLRDHYLYNINPWGPSLPQAVVEKQLKLYSKQSIALDISALKKQYTKLKQRQRQAHIIFSAAISRQSPAAAPVTMNHLLLGKSALVPAKRLGPPKGAIPPARQTPSTLLWKDAPKQTSSSSSSDTELCDDDSGKSSSDEEPEEKSQFDDNLPRDSDNILMRTDNTNKSAKTSASEPEETVDVETNSIEVDVERSSSPSQSLLTENPETRDTFVTVKSSESDDENFDFERFLADRVKCLKEDDVVQEEESDDRINCARRNSAKALQIIQENSLILHRILQCQSRLSPSPPPIQVEDKTDAHTVPSSHYHDPVLFYESHAEIDTTTDPDRLTQILFEENTEELKSPEYGSKYTSILEKSKSLDEKYNALILNIPPLKQSLSEQKNLTRICEERKLNNDNFTQNELFKLSTMAVENIFSRGYKIAPPEKYNTATSSKEETLFSPEEQSNNSIRPKQEQTNSEPEYDLATNFTYKGFSYQTTKDDDHPTSAFSSFSWKKESEDTISTAFNFGISDTDSGIDFTRSSTFDLNLPSTNSSSTDFNEFKSQDTENGQADSSNKYSFAVQEEGPDEHSKFYKNLLSQLRSYPLENESDTTPKEDSLVTGLDRRIQGSVEPLSENRSDILQDRSDVRESREPSTNCPEDKKSLTLNVSSQGESSTSKSPLKSPLKSPSKAFNPFPVPLSSRQSKEVPLKLGLYKK
ncbi:uncharacterized protein LOC108905130 [Anoplophora glabripennis]|uniref:uncharacterized protein LOC108905130 n=1 Tax=Anoplophora glabripennis TaxID=217634 RepID=UPI000C757B21|nr:uncharacterized protein LOC108905130 [Anoplophora glabripennis]